MYIDHKKAMTPVQWGQLSMVDAERRLLANALLDPLNCRFVLLSDSCIPLFNFSAVYGYLAGSHLSFVHSFDDPRSAGRGRYNKRMWRRSPRGVAQGLAVVRGAPRAGGRDRVGLPLLPGVSGELQAAVLCRRALHTDAGLQALSGAQLQQERHVGRLVRRWGPPAVYRRRDVSEGLLRRMRDRSTTSCCSYNERATSVCFLFARKFDASALEPLMLMAPALLGF
uniref:Uncharacterized protein n=1 Tax=Ananas comosus var. bracteatus TaxID=296719 RepID=A0A6V7PVS6_ANACO|nr:unnamed protein product [Ananas comosus var. bracteatus]